MIRKSSLVAVLASTMVMASCASLKPSERPAYTGADTVSSANPSQLVGLWTMSDLNPYPQAEPQSRTIEYRSDGTLTGQITPEGESAKALGGMTFEMSGRWQLEEDRITHEGLEMKVISDGSNPMASLLGKAFSQKKNLSGQANIYELSANRIVMVGSDGVAMEYVRQ
ncbi:hypothetical protein IMCC3135_04715 [Granulosicoccus antarcticus IMCC3135]|uniref:DUF306 domain-containing protein n=2 Tax=Granulosicoccus TaxID=437504 RepID=A0A2Z2NIA4_9GAMM|nr:hypothetical protein IMCC3135_04715 [Granulosicoccus antarcticus IMCC3135]